MGAWWRIPREQQMASAIGNAARSVGGAAGSMLWGRNPLAAKTAGLQDTAIKARECRFNNSTNQTIHTTSSTTLNFDTVIFDNGMFRLPGDSIQTITFRMAGKYALFCNLGWSPTTNAAYLTGWIFFTSGGVTTNIAESSVELPANGSNQGAYLNFFGVIEAKVGDTAIVKVFQTSGADMTVSGVSNNTPIFGAFRIGL